MKLLHKTTSLYLGATVVILLVASIVLFLVLQEIVQDEMDEHLELQAELLAEQVRTGEASSLPMMTVAAIDRNAPSMTMTGDTLLYDRIQKKNEDYRYLTTVRTIKDRKYRLTVATAHIGWDHYYIVIVAVFLATALLLAITGAVINFLSSRRLWLPFFRNLKTLQEYSVASSEPVSLMDSDIHEFHELKLSLDQLMQRSRKDYVALREFTENASHEIQTPLTIIRSKLDRLSQFPMTAEMADHISQARADVSRLSRINRNLLLLAKLDNGTFGITDTLDIGAIVNDHLQRLHDLFTARSIVVGLDSVPLVATGNRYLFDILVTNMLSNAQKHTDEGGNVLIRIADSTLTMSNSGPPLDISERTMFGRFGKGHDQDSTGLGLAIVQEICLAHGWGIRYEYVRKRHIFIIDIRPH